MDKQLIYLLDGNIPSSEIEKTISQTTPYTQSQLAGMVMKGSEDLAIVLFSGFKDFYEDIDFTFLSIPERINKLIDSYKILKGQKYKSSWENIYQVKANLIADIEQTPIYQNGKRILWTHLYKILIESTANELILHKKKDYLIAALYELQSNDELNDETNISLKDLTVDQLFFRLFPKPKPGQIKNLELSLSKKGKYSVSIEPIIYVGLINRLWVYLKEIRERGYTRINIANTISEHCLWKTTEHSPSKEISYGSVYKNC